MDIKEVELKVESTMFIIWAYVNRPVNNSLLSKNIHRSKLKKKTQSCWLRSLF